MHGVTRYYSGKGAAELLKILEANKADVERTLKKVKGFRSYTLMRAGDACLAITICDDKAGTDESAAVARNWVAANAAGTGVGEPMVAEGPVIIHAT